MLHPGFPVFEGHYQMTREWWLALPGPFNRRFEDEDLVLWRPGLTFWIAVWNTGNTGTAEERLDMLCSPSPAAFGFEWRRDGGILRFAYRLIEEREEGVVHALYCHAVGTVSTVQMAAYADEERDLETAHAVWLSMEEDSSAPGG